MQTNDVGDGTPAQQPGDGDAVRPRFFLWLLPLSFVLQIAAIGILHQYRTRPGHDNFEFGWEMGRIGRSIAMGHGFSSPYDGDTGPSAWEPPLYPFLMGGVFRLFGIYTQASAWVLLIVNSFFATLTTILIFLIARRTFGGRVALWSAYAWALNPYMWYWSIHWIWDTTFTPFILACIFLLALEISKTGSFPPSASLRPVVKNVGCVRTDAALPAGTLFKHAFGLSGDFQTLSLWALFGALFGIGALANPTMLTFLPFCGLWIWRQRYRRRLPSVSGVVVASFAFWIALCPWLVRNCEVFGRFVFIRDDFGLQFRLGNGKGADGMLMAYLQPNLNPLELEKFQRLGELAYAGSCKHAAFGWVRENPERFAVISLKRFFYYWNGVPRETSSTAIVDFRNSAFLATSVLALWGAGRAVRQKLSGAWLFAGLALTYPSTYYFVFPHARYRHPIEPELLIMIVFLLSEVGKRSEALLSDSRTTHQNPV